MKRKHGKKSENLFNENRKKQNKKHKKIDGWLNEHKNFDISLDFFSNVVRTRNSQPVI